MEKKISAFLGPTNTGKTYNAIQKLFKYKSGVIGFPLRLLARENFELARKFLPKDSVALITGEEKIIPANARYFFCTVESIPENLIFEFVAIDEVQMASDYDRGYIFTEKILNKKGVKETLFLGSRSIENILRKIYPKIMIYNKPRLSKLSYIGYKNLTRLPKRTAIIAFSQIDVYEIANKIKQSHGGVSIVLGALSPDVRNAQVKLFEDEKVDYIVATDAIGMGLNLNIKNIFFSSIKKFDGFDERFLKPDEVSQIAGRAGRYSNDGFFGTTGELKKLNTEIVNFVENYEYTEIKRIFWRNNKLNFRSPKILLDCLSEKPKEDYLNLKKNASDHRYLRIFLNDKSIKRNSRKSIDLEKLWEVCGIPDYSKNLDEYHSRFLKIIFHYLISKEKKIPDEWVRKNLNDIKRKTNKIAELNYKISQVRIWSFISFKSKWLESDDRFQSEVKKLELKLSIKLHEELISQFIGELKNIELVKSNKLIQKNKIFRLEEKNIFFGKEKIGCFNGFRFKINDSFKKSKNIFNNKILNSKLNEISYIIKDKFIVSSFNSLNFTIDGLIYWNEDLIGKFNKDKNILNPKINVFLDRQFQKFEKEIILKIKNFFIFSINKEMPFIEKIKNFKDMSKEARALNFCLLEKLGHCERKVVDYFYKKLSTLEIKKYKSMGLKVGIKFFYFKTNELGFLKQMLLNVHFRYNLESFISEKIFRLTTNKKNKQKELIYEKLGFYLLEINKKIFLINYIYYETLSKKVFFFKKKHTPLFVAKNKFEKFFYDNSKGIFYSY